MKVSEITTEHLANYLRLEYADMSQTEKDDLDTLSDIAQTHISDMTGLIADEIDTHDDFVIVVYVLVQDMYDNRTLYVDKSNLNRLVESILGLHSTNLL
jgi:hypothetical protein